MTTTAPTKPSPLDGAIDFISGSLGGAASVYIGQPLDTVKVKLQTFPHLFTGPSNCLKQILQKEGLRGLYAGTVPALIANVAENSVLFTAYGACQKVVCLLTNTSKVDDLSTLSNASAGCLASFFSSFTLCPTELIKVQLQAQRELKLTSSPKFNSKSNYNAFTLTRSIIRREGMKGMFRGLGSTIAREMPGYFVFFGAYEWTRELFTPPNCNKSECGAIGTMVAGAAGGLALWTVIFPADLVKSRIQVSGLGGTFLSNTMLIVRKEGFLALYSGLSPTLVRTIPATAGLFLTYETCKKCLHDLFD